MAKVFRCRDIGMQCDFVARGDTEDEVMSKAAAHAKKDHGMTEIPADLVQKIRSAIKEE
jgi:predicted small metal-binding protein